MKENTIYFPQPLPIRCCLSNPYGGYGNMSYKIYKQLVKKIRVKLNPSVLEDLDLLIGGFFFKEKVREDQTIFYTMWESSILPSEFMISINKAKLIIVPSYYNKQVFINNKITRPVVVVPLGVDTKVYHKINTKKKNICTFGVAAGLIQIRKNIPFVINAFKKAFENKNAILKVKVPEISIPYHPQIEIIDKKITESDMCSWYNSLDTFVSCAHSEGFGLHQLEAMACGVPVISPKFGGVTEYFDKQVGYCVDYTMTPTNIDFFPGEWCSAVEESLIERMLQVYNNRTKAAELGLKAMGRASSFTWEKCANKLIKKISLIDYLKYHAT